MLVIFNAEPPIYGNIGNVILQRWIRVIIREIIIVSTHSSLLFPMVALLIPLGTFSPLLLLFFHLFGFIITQSLTYIRFTIALMVPNCHDEVVLIAVDTNNTVIIPHIF